MVSPLKLNEMRSVRAVANANFSISRTAEMLHASQPGISRHVLEVEQAMKVDLFLRRKNRLTGLTPAGALLLPLIDRILNDIDDLDRIAGQFAQGNSGSLSVATSHTHARYLLPPAIQSFIREFPSVDLRLRQGYVNQIAEWVNTGAADLSVSAAPLTPFPDLSFLPFSELHRVVLAPSGHPILSVRKPSLRELATWPIITYEREFVAHAEIMGAFKRARLNPRIVLSTGDTDIMKTYTLCGLGIAIVADHAFDEKLDPGLSAIDVRGLFPSTPLYVGIKRGRPLSTHAVRFIELIDPKLANKVAPVVRIDRE
jgi:DNA-binding transcriptional LysR family regulator